MHAPKKGAVDTASLASLWGPRLLRFYYLLCANQVLAESLAIETIAEIVRAGRWTTPVLLVRLALTKAMTLPCGSSLGGETHADFCMGGSGNSRSLNRVASWSGAADAPNRQSHNRPENVANCAHRGF